MTGKRCDFSRANYRTIDPVRFISNHSSGKWDCISQGVHKRRGRCNPGCRSHKRGRSGSRKIDLCKNG